MSKEEGKKRGTEGSEADSVFRICSDPVPMFDRSGFGISFWTGPPDRSQVFRKEMQNQPKQTTILNFRPCGRISGGGKFWAPH